MGVARRAVQCRGAHAGLGEGAGGDPGAGLAGLLSGGVEDHGDVPEFRWRPDLERPDAKHAAVVARVAADTAAGVARVLSRGQRPLVLGGDCSIVFAASPHFAGLVLTEINPDHAPDPGVLSHFLAVVAAALG